MIRTRRPLIAELFLPFREDRAGDGNPLFMVIDCAFPALSSSGGSGGRAPGVSVWEGVMISRAALNCSIFPAVSRQGAAMEQDPHRFSSLEKERSSNEKFSSRVLEPGVHEQLL